MAFSHDRDIAHFDRWAPNYDRGPAQAVFFRPLYGRALRAAARLVPAPTRVLDVGCGTGTFLRLAATNWPETRFAGVDPSSRMLEQAALADRMAGRIEFFRGRSEELPFEGEIFDLAVSTMSFHHWADQRRGLVEIARVLRPGGALLLADHFVIPSHKVIYRALRADNRFHTRSEIDLMLGAAGLRPGRWSILYRIGPLPIVPAVAAFKG